jgi:hypothetical protein
MPPAVTRHRLTAFLKEGGTNFAVGGATSADLSGEVAVYPVSRRIQIRETAKAAFEAGHDVLERIKPFLKCTNQQQAEKMNINKTDHKDVGGTVVAYGPHWGGGYVLTEHSEGESLNEFAWGASLEEIHNVYANYAIVKSLTESGSPWKFCGENLVCYRLNREGQHGLLEYDPVIGKLGASLVECRTLAAAEEAFNHYRGPKITTEKEGKKRTILYGPGRRYGR